MYLGRLNFCAILMFGIDPLALPEGHKAVRIGAGLSQFGPVFNVLFSVRDLVGLEYSASAADLVNNNSGFDWLEIQEIDFVLRIGFHVDQITMVMLAAVTFVGMLVQIYSLGYMHGERRYGWFFAMLSLFIAAMLTLVLAQVMDHPLRADHPAHGLPNPKELLVVHRPDVSQESLADTVHSLQVRLNGLAEDWCQATIFLAYVVGEDLSHPTRIAGPEDVGVEPVGLDGGDVIEQRPDRVGEPGRKQVDHVVSDQLHRVEGPPPGVAQHPQRRPQHRGIPVERVDGQV